MFLEVGLFYKPSGAFKLAGQAQRAPPDPMAFYIVSCKFTTPGRDYADFGEAVENLGKAWPCFDSGWLLVTEHTAREIRDYLKNFVGTHDDLLVAQLAGMAAWRSSSAHVSEGLKRIFVGQRPVR